jgi:hypothetical protein
MRKYNIKTRPLCEIDKTAYTSEKKVLCYFAGAVDGKQGKDGKAYRERWPLAGKSENGAHGQNRKNGYKPGPASRRRSRWRNADSRSQIANRRENPRITQLESFINEVRFGF